MKSLATTGLELKAFRGKEASRGHLLWLLKMAEPQAYLAQAPGLFKIFGYENNVFGTDRYMDCEREIGLPLFLMLLADILYKGVQPSKKAEFGRAFVSAPRVDEDYSHVGMSFIAWLLDDPVNGVINSVHEHYTRVDVQKIADLCRQASDSLRHQVAESTALQENCIAGDLCSWRELMESAALSIKGSEIMSFNQSSEAGIDMSA
jgi:hypothetical protein